MLSRINCVLAVAFAVVVVLGGAYAAPCYADPIQLIQNPSFESPTDLTPNYYQEASVPNGTYSMPGPNHMPGWTVAGDGTYDHAASFCFPNRYNVNGGPKAEDGGYFWQLNSAHYWLTQSFAVTAGATYNVSFYEGLRDGTGGMQLTLSATTATLTGTNGNLVGFSGSGTSALTGQANGGVLSNSSAVWPQFTCSFVASANDTVTLTLVDVNLAGDGTYLDNVTVTTTATPEPGTLALLAAGLAGLLCYAWRKRR